MKSGKIVALTGAILQVGPIFGILGTITGMIKTFEAITVSGTGNAEALSAGISEALVTTEIGLTLGFIGTIFLYVALLSNKYRSAWFYKFMMIYSILNLIMIPVGTIVGILTLKYLKRRKDEFFEDQNRANKSSLTTPGAAAPSA